MPRHIPLERGDPGLSDSGAGWPEAWPGRPQGAGQNIFPCIRGVPFLTEYPMTKPKNECKGYSVRLSD